MAWHGVVDLSGQTYSSKKKKKEEKKERRYYSAFLSIFHVWKTLVDHCSSKSDLPKFARVNGKAVQTQQKHDKTSLI